MVGTGYDSVHVDDVDSTGSVPELSVELVLVEEMIMTLDVSEDVSVMKVVDSALDELYELVAYVGSVVGVSVEVSMLVVEYGSVEEPSLPVG